MTLLLRKLKFRVNAEDASDWTSFYDSEFKGEGDPDLSTYRCAEGNILQLTVEHHGNANIDPPRSGYFVDVMDLSPSPHNVPEGYWFTFARDAHVQVGFRSFDQVEGLAQALYKQLKCREKAVLSSQGPDLKHYAAIARDESNVEEWKRFLSQASSKWVKFPRRKT